MDIKAVFFDIDGTLVNDSRQVLKSTKKAIASLKKQGILVGLATGRGPFFVQEFMEELNLDFAVTYNGQYIFSPDGLLYAQTLSKKEVADVLVYAQENGKEIALGREDGVLGSRIMSFGMSSLTQGLHRFVPRKLSGLVSQSFNKIVSRFVPQDYKELEAIAREPIYQILILATSKEGREIAEHFPHLKFTRSSPYASDIISPGMSKLEGIRLLGKEFDFDLDQVMAFGDSDNDFEMLSGVGLSIAMGNGSSRIKKVAQHTTSSNTEDGIHEALSYFGFLGNEPIFVSQDTSFNKVKQFHGLMDQRTQEDPKAWTCQDAGHRAAFTIEELVEFVHAASSSSAEFEETVNKLHQALDQAKEKVMAKEENPQVDLVKQADALVDLLYFTYGHFVLMGVDPAPIFDLVHQANMGKIFPDGKAHFDPQTHKILKPDDWEENYAPEPAIQKELERQQKAYNKHHCKKDVH
ncbi:MULTISPECIES: Cof-type HAD-IIB family hydrolase [unclassified Streptococcus]|uniref:Cof-type HAD-IIB family hydrolase n=1 Tax=unclassified Streptococcus TaxID=2608887 RepID=UPI001071D97E|nr:MULTISPECIES: Cof-type HAD-IIB family hydrolase [unclassified Streptococcus]MBF0806736.1 Cof-type HAD-IIB family hydrolase [Streptococcus sp. 19428wA2_WM07]TFU26348.1 Cof-type HAD-IIB family hydrolase [Streptococcus sp. WM07]